MKNPLKPQMINWKMLKKAYGKQNNLSVWSEKEIEGYDVTQVTNGHFIISSQRQSEGAGLTFILDEFKGVPLPNTMRRKELNDDVEALTPDHERYTRYDNLINDGLKIEELTKIEYTGLTLNRKTDVGKDMKCEIFFNPEKKEYVFLNQIYTNLIQDLSDPSIKIYGGAAFNSVHFISEAEDEHVMVLPFRVTGQVDFLKTDF